MTKVVISYGKDQLVRPAVKHRGKYMRLVKARIHSKQTGAIICWYKEVMA